MNKLAIIIPAYKSRFFEKALISLANQTCKDFTLYIGNDASKEDISSIVEKYNSKLNIVYHYFNDNLGGKSLTHQWERCIALSKNEEYIWLFSDDDEISEDAVAAFYSEIDNANNYFDLYRFDLNIINEYNEITYGCIYSDLQDVKDFFRNRVYGSEYSCITQYIFKRSVYQDNKGFISFQMAWFSDDASIIRFGKSKGIKKISNGNVKWRLAKDVNITSSHQFDNQKAKSVFEYAKWFNNNLNHLYEKNDFNKLKKRFLSNRMLYNPLGENFRVQNIKTIFALIGIMGSINLYLYDIYSRIKMLINNFSEN